MKYQQSKVKLIEAQQFLDKNTEGVFDIFYDKVNDKLLGKVKTLQGNHVPVKQGEWIVKEPQQLTEKLGEDRYYPIADDYFKVNYMPYQDLHYYFINYEYEVSQIDGTSKMFFGSFFVETDLLSFNEVEEHLIEALSKKYSIDVTKVLIENFKEVSREIYLANSNYNRNEHQKK